MTERQISLHGLGFIQVKLPAHQRLHVWHPDLPRRECWESSNIHSHRWAFKSRVLVGRLADVLYRIGEHTGDDTHVAYSHEGRRAKTGSRPWLPVRNVKVSRYEARIVSAGEEYVMYEYEFHSTEILADNGKVATLIQKSEAFAKAAESLCEIGVEPDIGFDRFQLKDDELWAIVRDVLSA